MKNSPEPSSDKGDEPDIQRARPLFGCPLGRATLRLGRRQFYAWRAAPAPAIWRGAPLGSGRRARRGACKGCVMEDETGQSSRWPVVLVLACAAAVGWLIAAFLWWQSSQNESQLNEALTATERARESLASDLQNLQ